MRWSMYSRISRWMTQSSLVKSFPTLGSYSIVQAKIFPELGAAQRRAWVVQPSLSDSPIFIFLIMIENEIAHELRQWDTGGLRLSFQTVFNLVGDIDREGHGTPIPGYAFRSAYTVK